jgi:hypothetical protein
MAHGVFAVDPTHQFNLCCGEIWGRGDDVEVRELHFAHRGGDNRGGVEEDVVDRGVVRLFLKPDAARSIPLGITINKEDALFSGRETSGEIDGGCGLANPALLVGDCDNSSHGDVFR